MFHPWDRALYLSQTTRRSFLHPACWRSPFQGISQTLVLRVLSASMFFPLEESMTPVAGKMLGGAGAAANFVAGNVAGGISAALLNPIQAVRYRAFSLNAKSGASSRSFLAAAQHMSARGGIRPFFKGIYPTVYRDLIFGGLYSLIRHELFHRLSPALPAGVRTHTHAHTHTHT